MFFLLLISALASAETTYQVELKDRTMNPSEIRVKAGEPFWLEIKNTDSSSEEIESNSLKFEKIVPPRRTIKIKVGKVAPGTYDIFGEFHADTCKGVIIAEEAKPEVPAATGTSGK